MELQALMHNYHFYCRKRVLRSVWPQIMLSGCVAYSLSVEKSRLYQISLSSITFILVCADNQGVRTSAYNPGNHARTEHNNVQYHYIRHLVESVSCHATDSGQPARGPKILCYKLQNQSTAIQSLISCLWNIPRFWSVPYIALFLSKVRTRYFRHPLLAIFTEEFPLGW